MPLQCLRVPGNNYLLNSRHLYSAFCLGLLLPVLNDDEKLNAAIESLFGKIKRQESAYLMNELAAYSQENDPSALNFLIDTYLKPRLEPFVSEANAGYTLQDIEEYKPYYDHLAIKALEQLTNTRVNLDDPLRSMEPYEEETQNTEQRVVYLTRINNIYLFFINLACLSEEIKSNLFSPINIQQEGLRTGVENFFNPLTMSYNIAKKEYYVVKNTRKLCEAYLNNRDRAPLTLGKQRILNLLMSQQRVKEIVLFLNEKNNTILGPVSNMELLRKTDASWSYWLLQTILLIITAPISIPVLMLHSRLTRGTINFLKTEGSFLVDDILALCNSAQQGPTLPEIITPPYEDHSEHAPETPANERTTTMLKSGKTLQTQQKASRVPPTGMRPFEKLNATTAAVKNDFFSAMVDNSIDRDTGVPQITSYRINSDNTSPVNTFSMDINNQFRWTNQSKMRINIMFFNRFEIPLNYQVVSEQIPEIIQTTSLQQHVSDFALSFFYRKETVADLLEQAFTKTGQIIVQEPLYLRAYALADNPIDRTKILEHLINAYGQLYDYFKQNWDLSAHRDGVWQGQMNWALTKLNEYKHKLPENYRTMAPSPIAVDELFQKICSLIQAQQMDKAWEIYANRPNLTPFIKHTFPNLEAMDLQLETIFILSRHKMYYGPGRTNYIPEPWIIENALKSLRRMSDLLAPFNIEQQQAFINGTIMPVERLIKAGVDAAQQTPYGERCRLRAADTEAAILLRKQGIDATYRVPGEDMDADNEPRVTEVPNSF